MHGYYSTCAFMHNFTPTDVGVFLVKMCISQHFFYFALTDASALKGPNENNAKCQGPMHLIWVDWVVV